MNKAKLTLVTLIFNLFIFSTPSHAIIIDLANVYDVQGGTGDVFNVSSASDIYGWMEIDDTAYTNQHITDFSTDVLNFNIQVGDFLWSSQYLTTDTIINNTLYLGHTQGDGSEAFAIMLDYTSMFDAPTDGTSTLIQIREVNGNGGRVIFGTDWAVHPDGEPLSPAFETANQDEGTPMPAPPAIALFALGLIGLSVLRGQKGRK